jgi:hypothetical protein
MTEKFIKLGKTLYELTISSKSLIADSQDLVVVEGNT